MYIATQLRYRNFKLSAIITAVIAISILLLSFYVGKDELFLLFNMNLGATGDFFFKYGTHAGDGLLWIVWLIAILLTKRKHLLPLIISAFILSTLFTQVGKLLILPDEFRPAESIKLSTLKLQEKDDLKLINGVPVVTFTDMYSQINTFKKGDIVEVIYWRNNKMDTSKVEVNKDIKLHLVNGVDVHSYGSFPSGHTATAFTFALLIALLIPSATVSITCILIAIIIGYSRIYLSQHYPLDVAAGMIVAVFSVTLAVLFQNYIDRKRRRKTNSEIN